MQVFPGYIYIIFVLTFRPHSVCLHQEEIIKKEGILLKKSHRMWTKCQDKYNIQAVLDKFYILIFCYYFRLVGGIDAHYTSFESLDPPSFIFVMTERMDD